jgi:glycine reductase
MPRALRVVHYINAFYGGLGGERAAETPIQMQEGPVGPGRLLAQQLAGQGEVASTFICGDGYFTAYEDDVAAWVRARLEAIKPDIFIAGPAFRSGRYGLACGRVCLVAERLGIPAVTGMHSENPGSDLYRGEHLYMIATEASAVGMPQALARMVALGLKRSRGEPIGSALEEGFLPRAVRRTVLTRRSAAERAVDMALRKVRNEPFVSELTIETFERIPAPLPLRDLSTTRCALVTEAGLVQKGNPHRLPSAGATHWASYSIAGMDRLVPGAWDVVHGGYDNTAALQDPNRVVPLDALRELERSGQVGELLDTLYVTVGNLSSLNAMRRIGADIAVELQQRGVGAVIVPAT